MSRIGKQPVVIPNGVIVEIHENTLKIKGPKGELVRTITSSTKVSHEDNKLIIARADNSQENRALQGLNRSLIANMVEGVSKGFEKRLEIVGVGYRAQTNKNKITLSLGYSHPVEYIAPQGIEFKMDEEAKNTIIVSGIDKQIVGEVAAKVRSYRKPEPYKGKGIKYSGEHITRKAGKAAGAA